MAGVTEAKLTDAAFQAAEARGRALLASEPRAAAARYDKATGRVVVDLVNGCTDAFPPVLVEDLQGASDDDLAGVEVDGGGFNLHWPALDADLYVPALVAGVFGTSPWMGREPAPAGRRHAGNLCQPAETMAHQVPPQG